MRLAATWLRSPELVEWGTAHQVYNFIERGNPFGSSRCTAGEEGVQ